MHKTSTVIGIIIVIIIGIGLVFWGVSSSPENDYAGANATSSEVREVNGKPVMEPVETPPRDEDEETVEADETTSGSADVSVGTGVEASNQAEVAAVVTYTDNGFSPQTVTIERGERVKFVDEAADKMWVASSQHPTHTVYAGTTRREHCQSGATDAFDQCGGGQVYTFTFLKTGEWLYHNHLNSSAWGKVIVK